VLDQAGVRIAGAHIAQVGPLAPLLASHPGEQVWDTGGRVLLPGLVDAHAHLARHLARGLGLEREADWECYDRALAPEDVLWGSMAALTEALRHGITTVYDVHRSASCLDLSLSELATAGQRLGVRLATCYAVDERDAPAEPGVSGAWGQAEVYYERAWVSGARFAAQHFGEGLGTIEPGAPADLVLLDYHPATDLDADTLPAHVAAGLARAPVSGAMVAG